MVSDPTEDFYDNLEALFADCKPVDGDLVQLRVSSVEPFKHVEGTRIGTRSLDIKSKKTVKRLESQAPQEGWYRYRKRAVSRAWSFGDRAANAEGYCMFTEISSEGMGGIWLSDHMT